MPPSWIMNHYTEEEEEATVSVFVKSLKCRQQQPDVVDDDDTTLPDPSALDLNEDRSSKVQFDFDSTRYYQSLGRHEISMPDTVWYTESEFADISEENRLTVKHFRQHAKQHAGMEIPMNLGNHCLRGLEHRLKGCNEARRSMTSAAINAVLTEQFRQQQLVRMGGSANYIRTTTQDLAKEYRQNTQIAVAMAIAKARKDIDEAKSDTADEVAPMAQEGCAKIGNPSTEEKITSLPLKTEEDDDDYKEDEAEDSFEMGSFKTLSNNAPACSIQVKREKRVPFSSRFFRKKSAAKRSDSVEMTKRRWFHRSSNLC